MVPLWLICHPNAIPHNLVNIGSGNGLVPDGTSHYLNQCWFFINEVLSLLWHSNEASFTRDASAIDHYNEFENHFPKIWFKSPRAHWVNTLRLCQDGWHFSDNIFQGIFLTKNGWIWNRIWLKFVHKCPIDNNTALVQIMAWCRTDQVTSHLSEPMIA